MECLPKNQAGLRYDITKERWYAITELLVKAVSGSALVILRIVGWRLQRDTETARQAVELHDREERRFLPMLQTLSELQLAAQSVVNATHGLDRSIDIDARLRRDGLALSYLADSLVLADDDRRINVTPARQFASLEARSQTTLLPIRGLIVMLGQLTQIAPQLRAAHGDCVLVLVADLHVIALRCGTVASHPSSIHYLSHVDSRSENVGNHGVVRQFVVPDCLAQALRFGIAG
jgi:hypothetical protein